MLHRINVFEGTETRDATQGLPAENARQQYTVSTTLFKHGRVYNVGELIELDPDTAKLFLENNEIKEIT